jgi:hypothetical protein
MKFFIVLAALIAAAQANGYGLGYGGLLHGGLAPAYAGYGAVAAPAYGHGYGYGHVIQPRIDIAPGQVETAYINK